MISIETRIRTFFYNAFSFVALFQICCCGCCKRRPTPVDRESLISRSRSHEAWKAQYEKQKALENNSSGGPLVIEAFDDEDEVEDEEAAISIPVTITMGIIAAYIFLGATIFGIWEGWTPLNASYFCFVTVSTIGFGDLVPGYATDFQGQGQTSRLIGSAMYMLFGMAILSMCFSLIQEEIIAKFRWIAERMGLINKDNDKDNMHATDEEMVGTDNAQDKVTNHTAHPSPAWSHSHSPKPSSSASPATSRNAHVELAYTPVKRPAPPAPHASSKSTPETTSLKTSGSKSPISGSGGAPVIMPRSSPPVKKSSHVGSRSPTISESESRSFGSRSPILSKSGSRISMKLDSLDNSHQSVSRPVSMGGDSPMMSRPPDSRQSLSKVKSNSLASVKHSSSPSASPTSSTADFEGEVVHM